MVFVLIKIFYPPPSLSTHSYWKLASKTEEMNKPKTTACWQIQHRRVPPKRGAFSQVRRAQNHPHVMLTSHHCWYLGCLALHPPGDERCSPFSRSAACHAEFHNTTTCSPFFVYFTLAAQDCARLLSPHNGWYLIPAAGLLFALANQG